MADDDVLEAEAVEESGGAPKIVGSAMGMAGGMADTGKAVLKQIQTKEGRDQLLHDETMEPHVHLAILLVIVFFISIIIAVAGI